MRQLQQVLLLRVVLLRYAAGPGRLLGCQLVMAGTAAASLLVSVPVVPGEKKKVAVHVQRG
jgi:hypothetical protein